IFSLYQNAYLDQSLIFSSCVQNQFTGKAGRSSRGVKQAGFLVLYKTTMPGNLIEIGFISNPAEELFLMSESGQNIIASAIYRAFKEYKLQVEGVTGKPEVKIEPDTIFQNNTVSDTNPVVNNTDTLSRINITKDNLPFFRVQFFSSSKKKPIDLPEFKGLDNVRFYVQNGVYKYTCGNFNTLNEAITYQHIVQNKGFKDAFVVAFLNEERISPTEALKFSGN
ncbi:MAG TPA: N-acetylmuramoyl-L-alanine amidase, partial [Bacteroidales bacterium]|nr:N-acetylmuramoyl-L-alanine amidase [Bacteroidales bacterium]